LRKSVLASSLAGLGLLSFALWTPGDSRRFAIRFDPAAVEATKAFLAAPARPSVSRQPNVVLIVADDLGYYDTSLYAPSRVETPHLERLAETGATFSAGYVTAPVCSPSRAALLTGRYQQRFGFELLTHDRYPRNRLELWFARTFFSTHGWRALDELLSPSRTDIELQGVPPSEATLAELLKKHGYATSVFGKWHLGFGETMLPQARGFDYQYGFYDAFSLYADPRDPAITNARGSYFADRYQWWRGRSGGSAVRRNGAVVEEQTYLTTQIAREAARWIEAQGENDKPFFAYVPFSAPHAPMQAPRAYVERFADVPDPDKRVYYAMISLLDEGVGEILAAVDRLPRRDDTIVVFLSDNGAAAYTGIADNLPLKLGKLTGFEGGVRVPFVLRWPGRVAGGARYTEPVSSLDVFMTIATASGAALPSDRGYDGVDLVAYLRGEKAGSPHDALFWRCGGHRAIRAGRYKLISDARTGSRSLFDIEADPSESVDLLAREPAIAAALEERLRAWEVTLAPPRWPPAMEYHFSDGGREYVFPL
jgi:arylsulfatase A-like enzyme